MKTSHLYILALLLFICHPLFSQQGNLYLHNYKVPFPNIDYHNTAAVQSNNNLMYFANTKGVLCYDGTRWNIISTPGTPVSLKVDSVHENRLYIGCTNDFGYLFADQNGKETYQSLSDSFEVHAAFTKIIDSEKLVYFYSKNVIVCLNKNALEIEKSWASENEFAGVFVFDNQVYVNINKKGFHKLTGEELTPVNIPHGITNQEIISSCAYDTENILLGTNKNNLYLFNGNKLTRFIPQNNNYIQDNLLSVLMDISEKSFILGTRSGGCIVIEKSSGKTQHTINYQTGLPDDEVLALSHDNQGGLWICNEKGITRTDLGLPVENFSYPGLEGNITSILKYHNTLYVSTSLGLYYLGRVTKLEEVQHLIKKEHKQTTSTKSYRTIKSVTKLIKVTFNSHVGPVVKQIPITIDVPVDSVATSVEDIFTDKSTRKNYALQSIPYVFKKIKGINAKCHQMIPYQGKILVASNVGLYEADTLGARELIKDEYVNFIHQSRKQENLFYVGLESGLKSLEKYGNTWHTKNSFDDIDKPIYSIAELLNILWLGSENRVYQITEKNGNYSSPKTYEIYNNFSEIIKVRRTYGGVLLISSSGLYSIDYARDTIRKEPDLQHIITPTSKVFFNQPGYTWIKGLDNWNNLNTIDIDPLNVIFLELFPQIEDIYMDSEKKLWVISSNSIYTIEPVEDLDVEKEFSITVRKALDKNDKLLNLNNLTLNYNNNAIKFQLAANFYLSEMSTLYQYRLKGLHDEWSDWSNEPVAEFPWLPSGNYTFEQRAKNIFGQTSKVYNLKFKIKTPFWKTWWFIFSVILLMVSLAALIVLWRIKKLQKDKVILQQKINEATQEIRKQKDELENKNKKITDSINYAKRIQEAILPFGEDIKNELPNSFVLFKPRDIVSGDFYWFSSTEDTIVIIAADCTGHGVPGAFMSMIGNTLLNSIIKEKKIYDPAKILTMLDKAVIQALGQEKEDSTTPDGMDISICMINKNNNKLAFASANNSMYLCKPGITAISEIERVRGDGYGIGGTTINNKPKIFKTQDIDISEDTCCYIYSDGYVDQFGGQEGMKFKASRFKEILINHYQDDFEKQQKILDKTIDDWRKQTQIPQTDDITVIGFKLDNEIPKP